MFEIIRESITAHNSQTTLLRYTYVLYFIRTCIVVAVKYWLKIRRGAILDVILKLSLRNSSSALEMVE